MSDSHAQYNDVEQLIDAEKYPEAIEGLKKIVAEDESFVLGHLALARVYGPKPVSWASIIFIEVVRGTPLLIQLFFIFYALPHIGIKFSPFVAAVLGLGINYAAYEAENYRAGIQAIPRAQIEAAVQSLQALLEGTSEEAAKSRAADSAEPDSVHSVIELLNNFKF